MEVHMSAEFFGHCVAYAAGFLSAVCVIGTMPHIFWASQQAFVDLLEVLAKTRQDH